MIDRSKGMLAAIKYLWDHGKLTDIERRYYIRESMCHWREYKLCRK